MAHGARGSQNPLTDRMTLSLSENMGILIFPVYSLRPKKKRNSSFELDGGSRSSSTFVALVKFKPSQTKIYASNVFFKNKKNHARNLQSTVANAVPLGVVAGLGATFGVAVALSRGTGIQGRDPRSQTGAARLLQRATAHTYSGHGVRVSHGHQDL